MSDPRIDKIISDIREMGSAAHLEGMARYGINVEAAFGVSIYDLRRMAATLGTDHQLALDLWTTGNHEARLLACFVDDADQVTRDQMEAWALDFDSWDICDQASTSLFDRTVLRWEIARAWALREEEWVCRAGFAMMAGLAVHDDQARDQDFLDLFPLIQARAFDPRNFVKKAVNWALRNIGKRNLNLNQAAIKQAEDLLSRANQQAGSPRGGSEPERAARWVAKDALKELTSEKVQTRIQARS